VDAFEVTSEPTDDRVLVRVRGELDLATAPGVVDAVRSAREAGARRVAIDLRPCTFIDSSAARALVQEHQAADRDGVELLVVCPPDHRPVRLVLDLLGMSEVLHLVPTLWGDGQA
jgi:anti-anti-sigma factor